MKAREFANRLDWAMLDERQRDTKNAICGFWGVPPTLVGILERATFNNIEHLDLQFRTYCMEPWVTREEDSLNKTLLTQYQRSQGYKIEFSIEDAFRTDTKTLYESLTSEWDRGIISSNEWRQKTGRNPKENGDTYYVPVNYAPEETQTIEEDDNPENVVPLRGTGKKETWT